MIKFFKWTGNVLGGLIVLAFLAGLILYPIGMKKITKTSANITVESVNIPTDADAISRGKHVSVIWACTKCHGDDLSGKLLTNDPIDGAIPTFGAIPASNLTSGNGGIGQNYTDTDWVRTIRHGIKPNNQAAIYMYVSTLSNQDLGDLIAYLKQIPPLDSELPTIRYGPLIPILPALGIFTPEAELIDHNAPHSADPKPGATTEYGRYLSSICAECHGSGIANAMTSKNWKREDFVRTFNTGVLPDGRQLGPTMSSETFNELNDTELTALWLYLTSVKP
jgi:mono/diheme cytochrome c family protein